MDIEINAKFKDKHSEKYVGTGDPPELAEVKKRKTTTSTAVKNRYNAKTYDKVQANLPKSLVAEFRAQLAERGDTVTNVIRAAINAYLSDAPETENGGNEKN
jgi:hypothetical protein